MRLILDHSLIRDGAAIPFTAHASPPTVTMPRVKALTTGSVPSFLDLILNFAESDTSSSLAAQDTWLAQIKARGGNIVFYGDDTWLKLFPNNNGDDKFFARVDGTSSFFVSVSKTDPGSFCSSASLIMAISPAKMPSTYHKLHIIGNDKMCSRLLNIVLLSHTGLHRSGQQRDPACPRRAPT
jgi:predicted AlkP superfamily pyrophosphatase or phosphodiesterase